MYHFFYSVLNASTGSFLLAILAGIKPAITVNKILINTNITAPIIGRDEILETLVIDFIIELIGMFNNKVISAIEKFNKHYEYSFSIDSNNLTAGEILNKFL